MKEFETQIIAQQLPPEYKANTTGGQKCPLSATHSFNIAMWLRRAERDKLPGTCKRLLAAVGGDDVEDDEGERLFLFAGAGAATMTKYRRLYDGCGCGRATCWRPALVHLVVQVARSHSTPVYGAELHLSSSNAPKDLLTCEFVCAQLLS